MLLTETRNVLHNLRGAYHQTATDPGKNAKHQLSTQISAMISQNMKEIE